MPSTDADDNLLFSANAYHLCSLGNILLVFESEIVDYCSLLNTCQIQIIIQNYRSIDRLALCVFVSLWIFPILILCNESDHWLFHSNVEERRNQFMSSFDELHFNQGKEIDLNFYFISAYVSAKKEMENAFQATIQSFYYRYFVFIFHGKTRFYFHHCHFSSITFSFFIIVRWQACFLNNNTTKRSNTIWTVWRHTIVRSNILSAPRSQRWFWSNISLIRWILA